MDTFWSLIMKIGTEFLKEIFLENAINETKNFFYEQLKKLEK